MVYRSLYPFPLYFEPANRNRDHPICPFVESWPEPAVSARDVALGLPLKLSPPAALPSARAARSRSGTSACRSPDIAAAASVRTPRPARAASPAMPGCAPTSPAPPRRASRSAARVCSLWAGRAATPAARTPARSPLPAAPSRRSRGNGRSRPPRRPRSNWCSRSGGEHR